MKIKVNSLKETKRLADIFSSLLDEKGLFVTLTGDIGSGKTQFVRYVLENLQVQDKVTSPSFVILHEYKSKLCPIYHFDLYRLEERGLKSIIPELRQYSRTGVLTFVEWAEFGQDEIPKNSLNINIKYSEDNLDIREFEFSTKDEFALLFLNKFEEELNK